MEFTPIEVDAAIEANEALYDAPAGISWTRFPIRTHPEGETLRFRGLSFNVETGEVSCHERHIHLRASETALLEALMRRAGQIISAARLANQLGVTVDEIDERATALAAVLTEAGALALPREVEGIGYVLWH